MLNEDKKVIRLIFHAIYNNISLDSDIAVIYYEDIYQNMHKLNHK